MTITMPSWLQWLSWLAGSEWPQGDEDQMFALGDDWKRAGTDLLTIIPELRSATSTTLSSYTGDGADAIKADFDTFFVGDQSIETLAKNLKGLGDYARNCGTQIEYSKLQIITTLAITAAEIAWALSTLFGSAAVPAIQVTGQVVCRSIFRELLKKITTFAGKFLSQTFARKLGITIVTETVIGFAQELGIQAYQVGKGHRDSIDWKSVGVAAATSAAGAAVAFPVGHGAGLLLNKKFGPATTIKGAAARAIGAAIPAGLAGVGGGFVMGGILTGEWEFDPRMLGGAIGGAISGGVSGATDKYKQMHSPAGLGGNPNAPSLLSSDGHSPRPPSILGPSEGSPTPSRPSSPTGDVLPTTPAASEAPTTTTEPNRPTSSTSTTTSESSSTSHSPTETTPQASRSDGSTPHPSSSPVNAGSTGETGNNGPSSSASSTAAHSPAANAPATHSSSTTHSSTTNTPTTHSDPRPTSSATSSPSDARPASTSADNRPNTPRAGNPTGTSESTTKPADTTQRAGTADTRSTPNDRGTAPIKAESTGNTAKPDRTGTPTHEGAVTPEDTTVHLAADATPHDSTVPNRLPENEFNTPLHPAADTSGNGSIGGNSLPGPSPLAGTSVPTHVPTDSAAANPTTPSHSDTRPNPSDARPAPADTRATATDPKTPAKPASAPPSPDQTSRPRASISGESSARPNVAPADRAGSTKPVGEHRDPSTTGPDIVAVPLDHAVSGTRPDATAPTPKEPPHATDRDGQSDAGTAKRPDQDGQRQHEDRVVRFDSNEAGSRYGDTELAPTRDGLDQYEFAEAFRYTVNSWVNYGLRTGNLEHWVHTLTTDRQHYDQLLHLSGGNYPALDHVHALRTWDNNETAAGRTGLRPEQRQAVDVVLDDPAPSRRIDTAAANAGTHRELTNWLYAQPTPDLMNLHAHLLDNAVGHTLPEPVEVVRGMRDVSFLRVGDSALGQRDPRALLGTVQTELGYMSTSLGSTPPAHFDGRVRMELELPEGSTGLWMGERSAYPDQREVILPRGTRYLITDVIENPTGNRYSGVEVLIRGRVIPAPTVYVPPADAATPPHTTSTPTETAAPPHDSTTVPDSPSARPAPDLAGGAAPAARDGIDNTPSTTEHATGPTEPSGTRIHADELNGIRPPEGRWKSMPGEGDCLFHALSESMGMDADGHSDLRARLAIELNLNREHFLTEFHRRLDTDQPGRWNNPHDVDTEYTRQIESLLGEGEYRHHAGNFLLPVAAQVLQLNLAILHPDGTTTRLPHGFPDQPFTVLFRETANGGHFHLATNPDNTPATIPPDHPLLTRAGDTSALAGGTTHPASEPPAGTRPAAAEHGSRPADAGDTALSHPTTETVADHSTVADPSALPHHEVRTFLDDGAGEHYGEGTLGPIRDALPVDQFNAVHRYTEVSLPNSVLRSDNTFLHTLSRDGYLDSYLRNVNGGHLPDLTRLVVLGRDPNHALILDPILKHPRGPIARLQEISYNAQTFNRMWQNFDVHWVPRPAATHEEAMRHWETDLRSAWDQRLASLDSAVGQQLPEGVRVIRGLHDARFFNASDGYRLGDRTDLSLLEHTVQQDPAYLSTSLGANLTVVDGNPFRIRMEIDVPRGESALWMGRRSAYPDQRELILPRGTRYEITSVERVAGNPSYPGVEHLIRARVVPTHIPDPVSTHRPPDLAGGATHTDLPDLAGGATHTDLPDLAGGTTHTDPPDLTGATTHTDPPTPHDAADPTPEPAATHTTPTPESLHFDTNEAGHRYGEEVLGPIRDSVPARDFDEAHRYTVDSWINHPLRTGDIQQWVKDITDDHGHYTTLLSLTDDPSAARLFAIREEANSGLRPALTDEQKNTIKVMLEDGNPDRRIDQAKKNSEKHEQLTQWLDGRPPTAEHLTEHRDALDRALSRNLPEPVTVVRGVTSAKYMRLGDGLLGAGDPMQLKGTVQIETGYMSTSLGATPPSGFHGAIRLELEVPDKSSALWMGSRSAYPNERELILPRGTRYLITDVVKTPAGEHYNGVQYLLKGKIVPATAPSTLRPATTALPDLAGGATDPARAATDLADLGIEPTPGPNLDVGSWPQHQLASGGVVYHATSTAAARNIATTGIREVANAWGGGALGSGFYTHQVRESAEIYVEDPTAVTLEFAVRDGVTGRDVPEGTWLGNHPDLDYRTGNSFLRSSEDPNEIKFHGGSALRLVAVHDNGTRHPIDAWLGPNTQAHPDLVAENPVHTPGPTPAAITEPAATSRLADQLNGIRPPEGRWKSMPGEGDCLFHALSESMGMDADGHSDLRARLASELNLNREKFLTEFHRRLDTDQPGRWNNPHDLEAEYVRQVESLLGEGEYRHHAGNFLLPVAAQVLELNLLVLHPDGNTTRLPHGFPDQPFTVLFREATNGGHFHLATNPDNTPATIPPDHPLLTAATDPTAPLTGGANLLDGPENEALGQLFDEPTARPEPLLDGPENEILGRLFDEPTTRPEPLLHGPENEVLRGLFDEPRAHVEPLLNTPDDPGLQQLFAEPEVLRFLANGAGENYGEHTLGPIRDSLPSEEFGEAHRYTVNSWVNYPLRTGDIAHWVANLSGDRMRYDTLYALDNTPPTPLSLNSVLDDVAAGRRAPLTLEQNQTILEILRDPAPDRRIDLARSNAETHWTVSSWIGGTLTTDIMNNHVAWLDQAVSHSLPEPLEVVRGMRDVSFLRVNGTVLGTGDPRTLLGTIQIEPGYMSTSLGATPPAHFDGAVRMELELPPGSTGLWMGIRSAYPDQRELILPRGTRYLITEVIENPPGSRYTGVQYLIRGRVELNAPVVYVPPATTSAAHP